MKCKALAPARVSVVIDLLLNQDFQHHEFKPWLLSVYWKTYKCLYTYILYCVPLDLHIGYQDIVFYMLLFLPLHA